MADEHFRGLKSDSGRYLFCSEEGYTFSPATEATSIFEPDVSNLQVLGAATGETPQEAWEALCEERPWIGEQGWDSERVVYYCLTTGREQPQFLA